MTSFGRAALVMGGLAIFIVTAPLLFAHKLLYLMARFSYILGEKTLIYFSEAALTEVPQAFYPKEYTDLRDYLGVYRLKMGLPSEVAPELNAILEKKGISEVKFPELKGENND